MTIQVHTTAVVENGAQLGDDVTVGPFSYIQDGVEIGAGTRIGPHVTVLKYTTIGSGCQLHAGSVIGDTPQDLSFKGDESYVAVGDNCIIRECGIFQQQEWYSKKESGLQFC